MSNLRCYYPFLHPSNLTVISLLVPALFKAGSGVIALICAALLLLYSRLEDDTNTIICASFGSILHSNRIYGFLASFLQGKVHIVYRNVLRKYDMSGKVL